MFSGIGIQELLIILVLVLIIFGAGKLPQVGEALGKGVRNFKAGLREESGNDNGGKKTPADSPENKA